MKNIFIYVLLSAVLLIVFSCDKDEEGNNHLNIENTEYALDLGFAYDYGGDNSIYNIDLSLLTKGLIPGSTGQSGSGWELEFEVFTSVDGKIRSGSYTVIPKLVSGYKPLPNTAYVKLSQYQGGGKQEEKVFKSGILTITHNGESSYEVRFRATDSYGVKLSGYYQGNVVYSKLN
ncbi:MAG: hypothetical protein OIF50_03730 [Flavobacteriaceae bacterium]|nr:hypothetical protein [Flavobacteriaceae bacterium]